MMVVLVEFFVLFLTCFCFYMFFTWSLPLPFGELWPGLLYCKFTLLSIIVSSAYPRAICNTYKCLFSVTTISCYSFCRCYCELYRFEKMLLILGVFYLIHPMCDINVNSNNKYFRQAHQREFFVWHAFPNANVYVQRTNSLFIVLFNINMIVNIFPC